MISSISLNSETTGCGDAWWWAFHYDCTGQHVYFVFLSFFTWILEKSAMSVHNFLSCVLLVIVKLMFLRDAKLCNIISFACSFVVFSCEFLLSVHFFQNILIVVFIRPSRSHRSSVKHLYSFHIIFHFWSFLYFF